MSDFKGKGDKHRPHNKDKFNDSFDRIFGKKKAGLSMKVGHYKIEDVFGNKSVGYWGGNAWMLIGDLKKYSTKELEIIKTDFIELG